jgi:hypothetical protein
MAMISYQMSSAELLLTGVITYHADANFFQHVLDLVDLPGLRSLPFPVDLWKGEPIVANDNAIYELVHELLTGKEKYKGGIP